MFLLKPGVDLPPFQALVLAFVEKQTMTVTLTLTLTPVYSMTCSAAYLLMLPLKNAKRPRKDFLHSHRWE